MPSANVNDPQWEVELPEPHRLRAARVGAQAGGQAIGATLYEVEAGGADVAIGEAMRRAMEEGAVREGE